MGRTTVRRVNHGRGGRSPNTLLMLGGALILLFAIVGVVSAGAYVAGKVSTTSSPRATHSGGTPAGSQDGIAQARAEATQIVRSAQSASNRIVTSATSRASRQANRILAVARRNARHTTRSVSQVVPTPAPAVNVPPPILAPTAIPPSYGAFATAVPTLSTQTYAAPKADLSHVPASWLVVGYNASFGAGPGAVGGVTVTNRSGKTFSGTATVAYTVGGKATATFGSVAPGQTVVLPLNGSPYHGGGYSISMSNLH